MRRDSDPAGATRNDDGSAPGLQAGQFRRSALLRRRLPPLNALKAFEATARHMSFTAAAEELLVTQSAISRQVRGLEEWFNVRLFDRQRRSLNLTGHGRHLHSVLGDLFDRLEQTSAEVLRSHSELRIRVPPTFATRWLVPRLHDFKKVFPELTIHISTSFGPFDSQGELFDVFIICENRTEAPSRDFQTTLILRECLTPVTSPVLASKIHRVDDLVNHTLIHSTVSSDRWKTWLRLAGVKKRADRQQYFELMDTTTQAAIQGLGVALVNPEFIQDEVNLGRASIPFPTICPEITGYYFLERPGRHSRKHVKPFKNWLASLSAK